VEEVACGNECGLNCNLDYTIREWSESCESGVSHVRVE
jgi:hypothetical protein